MRFTAILLDLGGIPYVVPPTMVPFDPFIIRRPWNKLTREEYDAWYVGKPFQFLAGCMTLYSVPTIRKFDFPDREMRVRHDDIILGELARQYSLKVSYFSNKLKQTVREPFSGTAPGQSPTTYRNDGLYGAQG